MSGRRCDCPGAGCPLAAPLAFAQVAAPPAPRGFAPELIAARLLASPFPLMCECCEFAAYVLPDGAGGVLTAGHYRVTRMPAPACPAGFVAVAGTFRRSTSVQDLAARIAAAVRPAPVEAATEDLIVTAQVKRARECEPIRALHVLGSAVRSLVDRRGLTPERGAALRFAIENTKAALRGERN